MVMLRVLDGVKFGLGFSVGAFIFSLIVLVPVLLLRKPASSLNISAHGLSLTTELKNKFG